MIFGRLKLYAIASLAFVAAIFGIYLRGKAEGRQDVVNEHIRRRISAMKQAKDIRDEIESDPHLADRARSWVRRDDKR